MADLNHFTCFHVSAGLNISNTINKYILGAKTASEVEGAIFQFPAEFPTLF